jgi:hypothetical protein
MKTQLEKNQRRLLSSIEILRSDINKREEWTSTMKLPSKEELDLMKSEVAFTRKHLDSQKGTLAILSELKDKRTDEVCLRILAIYFILQSQSKPFRLSCIQWARLESLGEKISDEMVELEEQKAVLVDAFVQFGGLDEQQAIARETIVRLSDMNDKHAKGIQHLDKMLLLPSSSATQQREAMVLRVVPSGEHSKI